MLKFRKNLIAKQVSRASTKMYSLKIGAPKLEIDGGPINSWFHQQINPFIITFQKFSLLFGNTYFKKRHWPVPKLQLNSRYINFRVNKIVRISSLYHYWNDYWTKDIIWTHIKQSEDVLNGGRLVSMKKCLVLNIWSLFKKTCLFLFVCLFV